jgi:hypothetical protein
MSHTKNADCQGGERLTPSSVVAQDTLTPVRAGKTAAPTITARRIHPAKKMFWASEADLDVDLDRSWGGKHGEEKAIKVTARASTRRAAASEFKITALAGTAARGREWDPAQPLAQAPALQEVREPRPYKTRYPIPNDAFEALKAAAPKAKLGKITTWGTGSDRPSSDGSNARRAKREPTVCSENSVR